MKYKLSSLTKCPLQIVLTAFDPGAVGEVLRYADCEEHTSTILKYVLGAVGEIDTEVLEVLQAPGRNL